MQKEGGWVEQNCVHTKWKVPSVLERLLCIISHRIMFKCIRIRFYSISFKMAGESGAETGFQIGGGDPGNLTTKTRRICAHARNVFVLLYEVW